MQLEVDAGSPLLVRHLEQIDLWHCPGDIQQRIDSAKAFEGRVIAFRRFCFA